MDEVKRWNEKHDLVGRDLPVLRNWLDDGLRAAKGGSVVGLSSIEQEGPAGGRWPRVYDQLPDG